MHLLGYHLPQHGFLIKIQFHRGCAESSLKKYQLGLFLTFAELELDRRMDILSYRRRSVVVKKKSKTPKEYMLAYLREHNIYHIEDECEEVSRTTMSFGGYPNSPSERIEACIYWHLTAFEGRVYYAEPGPSVVADSKYLAEAYKLINFINSHVWPKNQDGADGRVYGSSYLIQPRFYITDEYDITATIVADYSLSIEIAPLELADFITAAIPELLESLAPYIFGVVVGSLRLEDAIQGIKHNVLFEEA